MNDQITLFDCLEWNGGTTSANDHVIAALRKAQIPCRYRSPGIIEIQMPGEDGYHWTLECRVQTIDDSTFINVVALRDREGA